MKDCSIQDCVAPGFSKGYCKKHYDHIHRFGKLTKTRYDARPATIDGDIAKLPLGVNARDGYAIVDKEYAYLDQYKWRLDTYGYAVAWKKVDGKKTNLRLQRVIKDTKFLVDHINGNKLDNRVANLREATVSQNTMNKGAMPNNRSGFKGVCFHKASKKYRAHIGKNGKQWIIGNFNTAIEAAKAYNKEALIVHGEFARLNNV